MNIWWIIRSLILLAVVVILFSVARWFPEFVHLKVVTQKRVVDPVWMGHGQLLQKRTLNTRLMLDMPFILKGT